MNETFKNPDNVIDKVKFDQYCKSKGIDRKKILTSKDFANFEDEFSIEKLVNANSIDPDFSDAIPRGFVLKKTILPFSFLDGSIMAMIYAEPHAEVKPHKHNKGFFRVVHQGELIMNCDELEGGKISLFPGDWIYVPSGIRYGYVAGRNGYYGGMCHCTRP
jgi:mannose-6-phosphate isomerase-like protein (cupin superfamily)